MGRISTPVEHKEVERIELPLVLKRFEPGKLYLKSEVASGEWKDGTKVVFYSTVGSVIQIVLDDKTYEFNLVTIAEALKEKVKP